MEKKLTKNEKGITLVALIITIIVLLILAVVSIRAITGDNILEKAESAKEKYTNSKEIEENKLADFEASIDNETKENEEKLRYYYASSIVIDGVTTPGLYAIKINKNNLVKAQTYFSDGKKYITYNGEESFIERVLEENVNIGNIIISKGTKVLLSKEDIESDDLIIITEDNLYVSGYKFTKTELNDEIRNIINSAVPGT